MQSYRIYLGPMFEEGCFQVILLFENCILCVILDNKICIRHMLVNEFEYCKCMWNVCIAIKPHY